MAKLTSKGFRGQREALSYDRFVGENPIHHANNHGDGQAIVPRAGTQEEPVRESEVSSKRFFVAGKVFNNQKEAMKFLSLIK
jgi:hypothetical protein